MKTIIVYQSNTGHTREYAEMLAKKLNCQAIPLNKVSTATLREYEQLVFGGWVRASVIVGLNKFIKKIPNGMSQMLVIFAVGADGSSKETKRKLIDKNNEISLFNCPFFYLQGGFDPEKLKFPIRFMLEGVAKSLKKKQTIDPESLTQDDKEFLAFFQNEHNDVDDQNLAEILACLQDMKTNDIYIR
ncbi:flavodoxin domain-containing protein [Eubacteriaceae bacterium ES2]|nr:flavodoxin domain-containing protein [Eubacteriaceae bacterium ES2]